MNYDLYYNDRLCDFESLRSRSCTLPKNLPRVHDLLARNPRCRYLRDSILPATGSSAVRAWAHGVRHALTAEKAATETESVVVRSGFDVQWSPLNGLVG